MDTSLPFGLVFDPRYLLHDAGMIHATLADGTVLDAVEHPSSARIITRIHTLLTGSGMATQLHALPTREATVEEVAAFHTREYIERVERLSDAGEGDAGESAPVSAGSYHAALLAAGGSLAATDAVLNGSVRGAYVLARPPGHHAVAEMGMGFCLFNNVALAALHARRRGVDRIMILDWDVHHGNGTQTAFYADTSILFISLHQDNWYPLEMGTLEQQGEGPATGTTLNIPLPAGTGDRGYLQALERVVEPAARRFRPDLIMVSAGQDASMFDPLGRMLVSMEGFRTMGTHVRALADDLCKGRLIVVQEGGYSEAYTPFCTLTALEGLTGIQTQVTDPYVNTSELTRACTILTDETVRAVDRAVEAHASWLNSPA